MGAAGVSSVRRGPMLDRANSSQLHGPVASKAEPTGDAGGASVVTYLRRGKNTVQQLCDSEKK